MMSLPSWSFLKFRMDRLMRVFFELCVAASSPVLFRGEQIASHQQHARLSHRCSATKLDLSVFCFRPTACVCRAAVKVRNQPGPSGWKSPSS